ncbi:xylulokinase [Oceanirhabdus seepicola]|uniref:FGGY-family carbohydrate kinase n=1 Tax=Oceanirhabdus seepicola TaxID=2828781 RepID=A0A9J6P0I6_9CLOT|nr:FGGY-family carbohydrate kinase [Oceanirhabdus seepicola]MCM1990218.1 FGGY-family carbohydrate kinase [Oceanirhabdus seepicola]
METYVIAYDVGTTGIKTCLFEISHTIKLIASSIEGYELHVVENGGVEQDPYDWWNAMCSTTKKVLQENNISPEVVQGISFCAQMQGLVLVDKKGEPIRRALSYMDNRAKREKKEGLGTGLQIAGLNVYKSLKSIMISGAVAASVKDPIWKYKWVQCNEPNNFEKTYKWLDVKEFLTCRATGEFVMTEDSAFATMLYDIRKGKQGFSKEICEMFGVNMEHLPKVVKSTDMVGRITKDAARELNLKEGTPVFGGGGDASLIGIGAGAVEENNTHIYLGTSGWVSTVVSKRILDLKHMIASIVGASHKTFNYFAELETAGKCLEWVKEHLALDEIDVYQEKKQINESKEEVYKSLYDYMMHAIKDVPAGSNGVIFTPWLHGNRCPFEDHNARGMFFNISLETGKTELIHSVIEGVCYHLRWQLEASEEKVKTSKVIRLVGGGALAPLTCQILSDVLNREIETVDSPQNIGAVGAVVVMAVGLNIIEEIKEAKKFIKVKERYIPNKNNTVIYDKYFKEFKSLYKNNKKSFNVLNN